MDKSSMSQMAEYLKKRKKQMRWINLLCVMGAVVVFCTTYALILPAITLEKTLICEQTEHTHVEACYETQGTLICELEETEGHVHLESCYDETGALICTLEKVEAHQHGDACYQTEDVLICSFEEHTHDDNCYESVDAQVEAEPEEGQDIEPENSADYTADVETEADWEATFADVELTGDWREDVLAIAESQLGYKESTKNYIVLENGKSKGYTRYGDWYGDSYGDWCAMFVSFCIHYADIPEVSFPQDANCANWVETLTEMELYHDKEDYTPELGDLIFFQKSSATEASHVALVKSVDEDGSITIIEGNSAYNNVREKTYLATDEYIIGYGVLEEDAVTSVISRINNILGADEIDAKMAEFEEAEDMEGLESWYTDVCFDITDAYEAYSELTEAQKARVYNADKLMELEYIWSAQLLIEDIDSDTPTTVASASTSEFVELNLYDYGSNINTNYKSNNKYPGFQWNGGAYAKSNLTETLYVDKEYRTSADRNVIDSIDFGNSMITDMTYGSSSSGSNGRSSNASIVGNSSGDNGAINKLDVSSYGTTNRPIGMSLNSSITDTSEDVLSRTLGSDGYPALTDGTSLAYLFKDGTYADKQNSTSIDGLFQQDTTSGGYYYNSRWNHAQYSNNKFTLYNQIITPNFITYPFGNFLPLNDITNGSNATQVSKITSMSTYVQETINDLMGSSGYSSNTTKQQLVDMLAMYRTNVKYYGINGKTWSTFTAKDAIIDYFCGNQNGDNPSDDTSLITDTLLNKMYNIDWDVKTNFFFGMEMKMNFIQPKGGMTGNDTDQDGESDYPMEFYFTGDDDVWVYIDDVLFLDLSGIHRHVGGKIDFVNGKVYYYYLDTENTGDVSTTPYQTYTFEQILSAAGKSTDGLNSNGTFKDYTTHSFKFYYMERGSGSSVCRLNFNFPMLRQNSISVSKEVSSDTEILGDPDYKFQVLKANSDGTKTNDLFIAAGTTYTIYDENDNVIGTGTTDANGVFILKAGQRAEFTGIKENEGKYYVRELLEGTVLEQYGNVTVSGESTTTSNNVTVGSDTFAGMDSPVKDMSDGATSFRFTNDVDEDELGTLNISKELTEYPNTRDVKYYDIQVTLDGELLPVGTEYTVDDTTTKTVATEGIITIAADETATISNILAGTEFTVQETSGSAEGYTVTYTDAGGYSITVNDGVVTGVIKTSANVQLVVTNSEKGTTVTIPGTKSMMVYDGEEHSYTFQLDEVIDSTGKTLKEGGIQNYTATATVKDEEASFRFDINYVQLEVGTLPATFYYRITETANNNTLVNNTMYVAEVTVSKTTDGITSEITGMWKDGVEITDSANYSADFVNTLVGNLTLTKTVEGTTESENLSFTFDIKLDDTNLPYENVENARYKAILTTAKSTTEEIGVQFTNGKATVTLKHGESLTIKDIPYNIKWTITETNSDGYKVTTNIDAGKNETAGNGIETSGSIVAGTTCVAYTNTMGYELPETGGMGTTPFIMGGIALVAGAFLYDRKRRKEDFASS